MSLKNIYFKDAIDWAIATESQSYQSGIFDPGEMNVMLDVGSIGPNVPVFNQALQKLYFNVYGLELGGGGTLWLGCYTDIEFSNVVFPNTNISQDTASQREHACMYCGYFDKTLGTQQMYMAHGSAPEIRKFNPTSFVDFGVAFPTTNGDINFNDSPSLGPTSVGGYSCGADPIEGQERAPQWLFFEDLVDGIPGETLSSSPNAYPAGLGLTKVWRASLTSGQDSNNAFIWVDLSTGRIVGRLQNTPGRADDSGGNFTEPRIFGKQFNWLTSMFIPDADSTPGRPKGELFIYGAANGTTAIGSVTGAFNASAFIRFIDFNPFSSTATGGQPTRLHERVNFESVLEYQTNPLELYGISGGTTSALNVERSNHVFYDPGTRRIGMIASTTTPDQLVGESGHALWQRAVTPWITTSPTARTIPQTNAVVEFETFLLGDLGEPVVGVQVDWELGRVSTLDEQITPAFPGTSQLANFPVDSGSLGITSDGVPLAETTDYTVDLATGEITWVTNQTGASLVLATYEHRGDLALPAFGELLDAGTLTDSDGRAITRVRYDDNDAIVGQYDRITATGPSPSSAGFTNYVIQQGIPIIAEDEITFIGLGSEGDTTAPRRLVYPGGLLPPITYAYAGGTIIANPDRTLNFDKQPLVHPLTQTIRTLTTTRVSSQDTYESDVIVTEKWVGSDTKISMITALFRQFYEYAINPPEFTLAGEPQIEWWPRDRTDRGWYVIILSVDTGGSDGESRFDVADVRQPGGSVIHNGLTSLSEVPTGYMDREVNIRYKIVSEIIT